MDARNRIADVTSLRCHLCQDFLKLVISDGWQRYLYTRAENEVTTNGRYKGNYKAAYEKMRDVGVENYSVDDMDVTIISVVVQYCKAIAPVQRETRDALRKITEDRNLNDHSDENEEPDELYLQGLLSLCNLREFVRTFDQYETTVDDKLRLEYRQKYTKEIESLKELLDDERISLIKWKKDIEKDIQSILDSNDQLNSWVTVQQHYSNRYWRANQLPDTYAPEKYFYFVVRASDAGISFAHGDAANYYLYAKKDLAEAKRRLMMLYSAYKELPKYEAKAIMDCINEIVRFGGEASDDMKTLIEQMKAQGHPIEIGDEGVYRWSGTNNKKRVESDLIEPAN